MVEWVKQLTPEFYIVVGFLIVLFIMLIIQFIRLTLVSRRLGTQDFKIVETISKNDEGELFLNITVSNQAFSTNNLNDIGFKVKQIVHVLCEVNRLIPPRNKHVETFSMKHIESISIPENKKFRKHIIYAENDLGDKQEIKAKVTNKYLKRRIRDIKRAEKRKAKEERFETGNYNFAERTGLILRLFGRPFYKLFKKMTKKTNYALRENEIRRQQKSEHDKIENELSITAAKARSIKIAEESKRYNKTRETKIELLKQQKLLEIETLKQEEYDKAFEERKAEVDAIDVQKEVSKYFKEHPIDYSKIDAKILKEKETETPKEKEITEEEPKKESKPVKEVSKKESTEAKEPTTVKQTKPKTQSKKQSPNNNKKPSNTQKKK